MPLKMLLDAMDDAIHVVDSELRIIFFNKSFQQWNEKLGLASKNILGKKLLEIFPFLTDNIEKEYRMVIRSGKKLVTEEFVDLKGQKIITITQKIPIFQNGTVVYVVTIVQDVTAQKTTEQKLEEREELYRGVIENANDAIYIITPAGFELVNPSFEKLTGYDQKEVTTEDFDFWDLIHPDDHGLIKQRERSRDQGEDIPSRYEFRIVDKKGEVKIVEATTVDIGMDKEVRVMGVIRDTTERVKAEIKLQGLLEKNLAILQALPDMMFILDKDGTYLDYYATQDEKLGVPPDKIIGANISDTGFSERQIEEIRTGIQTALDEQIVQVIEYTLNTPAGKGVFEARIAPLGSSKILSIIRDITEQKQVQERLQHVNEILRLTNKIMQHDILNDLQVVRSALDIYQDGQDEELLEKLASRLEQSVSLIKRIRELEKIVGTEKSLKACRVRDVVEDVAKGFDLDYTIDGDCTVNADAAFPSVIDNIIENAVVHGHTDCIKVVVTEKNSRCEIRIADHGTGIPEEIKKNVFKERFSHGGQAGSGLGMYIVKKTIERYGGTVDIEDNKPSGTVVIIGLETAASEIKNTDG